jgi:hypothetical protein
VGLHCAALGPRNAPHSTFLSPPGDVRVSGLQDTAECFGIPSAAPRTPLGLGEARWILGPHRLRGVVAQLWQPDTAHALTAESDLLRSLAVLAPQRFVMCQPSSMVVV